MASLGRRAFGLCLITSRHCAADAFAHKSASSWASGCRPVTASPTPAPPSSRSVLGPAGERRVQAQHLGLRNVQISAGDPCIAEPFPNWLGQGLVGGGLPAVSPLIPGRCPQGLGHVR